MNLLYIGIDREGTTSHYRANVLQNLLPDWNIQRIDTWTPFARQSRIARSLAFRFKRGPVIGAVNQHVLSELQAQPDRIDLTWIDKAVFLSAETTRALRGRSDLLLHYTPDAAFHQNRSHHFEKSAPHYDLLVTTKSFELDRYRDRFPSNRTFLTTQGYDETVHHPQGEFEDKTRGVVFAGLCEPSRERSVETLIDAGIPVAVAGPGWSRFASSLRNCSHFDFLGAPLEGPDYSRFLHSGKLGLGLLSKRFPELHTTRTFEIPACGTALVTERNVETSTFFATEEAFFFEHEQDLADVVADALSDSARLKRITEAGQNRIQRDGRSNHAIQERILNEILER